MPEDVGGEGHAQAPIYKKIIKVQGGGHHGGAWKVAYADLVTALMALFIVLWILSQSDELKQSVAGYFRDPVGFKDGGVSSVMEGGSEAQAISIFDPSEASSGRDLDEFWRKRADKIREAVRDLPSFSKFEDQLELAITHEGLRITMIESTDTPLFQVGSTALNPDAEEFISTIAHEIAELDNHMIIEGHTDSRPFSAGAGMTNWELSTGRGHTARLVLENAGADPARVFEVRGLADRQLYNPLNPHDSRNRRISITLLSEEAFRDRKKVGEATIID